MEIQQSLQFINSLVPVKEIQQANILARKYWHVICRAEFIIPLGLSAISINIFLIYYEHRLFLNIVVEIIPMLTTSEYEIESPSYLALTNKASIESIPLPCGPIPIAYNVFELPDCPRCFLGYSCGSHHPNNCQ